MRDVVVALRMTARRDVVVTLRMTARRDVVVTFRMTARRDDITILDLEQIDCLFVFGNESRDAK